MQFIVTITASDGTSTSENFTAQEMHADFMSSLLKVASKLPGGRVSIEVAA
jgi:hypothetical protein